MTMHSDSKAVPQCRVTSIYVDVSPGDPAIYEVRDRRGQWGFSRKEFLSRCAGLGCLGLLALMGVGIASSSEGCDTSSGGGSSSDSTPGGAAGGGTYCQCDQICTCNLVV